MEKKVRNDAYGGAEEKENLRGGLERERAPAQEKGSSSYLGLTCM